MEVKLQLNDKQSSGLKKRVEESGLDSIEEYLLFLIDQTIEEEDFDEEEDEEEDEAREKLKKMGYL